MVCTNIFIYSNFPIEIKHKTASLMKNTLYIFDTKKCCSNLSPDKTYEIIFLI